MECNNAELLSEGSALSAPEAVQRIYKLALLCRIAKALVPAMNCDPAVLLSAGAPFACLTPELQRIAELQLLCSISGGASQQVTSGPADPVGVPPAVSALYYNTTSSAIFEAINGAWVLKV